MNQTRLGPLIAITVLALFQTASARAEQPYSLVDWPTTDSSTTTPASAPASAPSQARDRAIVGGGLVEYLAARLTPYEPIYFLWGPEDPQIKFQFSVKYQILNPRGDWIETSPFLRGFHFAYTQTSFWDIAAASGPFYDTSYKPELLYLWDNADPGWLPGMSRFDLHAGLQHESNGKGGLDSRSLNIIYVRPVFTFGDPGTGRGLFVTVAPRAWIYLGDLHDNPDIAEYRGYGDLKLIVGQRDGLQLAAIARIGSDFDRGSLELDLSFPLRRLINANPEIYLFAQYFTGYGESLLGYNQNDSTFRFGIALVR